MIEKPTMSPLSDSEIKALDFIELHWHKFDLWPELKDIKEAVPDFNETKAYLKDRFLNALHNRGLPGPPVERKYISRLEGTKHEDAHDNFSPAQIAVVVTLTDFYDQRSDFTKLKSLGITTTQFNGWMRNREFKQFFNALSRKHFAEADHLARKGLIKGMDKGDLASIKYFNELTGESPEERNVQVLLSRIVEAIQLHVKDPVVLHRIEQSFAQILGNAHALEAEVVPHPVKQLEGVLNDMDLG